MGRDNYFIDEDGYYRFKDSKRLVHRWIAEKHVLGRKLRFEEVVHHINGNKRDNRSENLRVFSSQDEHYRLHREEKRKKTRDKALKGIAKTINPFRKRKKASLSSDILGFTKKAVKYTKKKQVEKKRLRDRQRRWNSCDVCIHRTSCSDSDKANNKKFDCTSHTR